MLLAHPVLPPNPRLAKSNTYQLAFPACSAGTVQLGLGLPFRSGHRGRFWPRPRCGPCSAARTRGAAPRRPRRTLPAPQARGHSKGLTRRARFSQKRETRGRSRHSSSKSQSLRRMYPRWTSARGPVDASSCKIRLISAFSMKERTSALLDPMTAMRPSIDTFFACSNLSR